MKYAYRTLVKWYWLQNRHARRQTWRSAILFKTNSTWNCPSNPGFRGERSATDRLCPTARPHNSKLRAVFPLLSYEFSCIFCLYEFRSECLNILTITCAMSVGERKCRGRCNAVSDCPRMFLSSTDRRMKHQAVQCACNDTIGVLVSLRCWWQVISQFHNSVATTIRSLWTTSCTYPNW